MLFFCCTDGLIEHLHFYHSLINFAGGCIPVFPIPVTTFMLYRQVTDLSEDNKNTAINQATSLRRDNDDSIDHAGVQEL